MATKQKRHHKKPGITIPLAVVAGFLPIGLDVGQQIKNGDWNEAGNVMVHNLLGINRWNNKWDTQGFSHGLYPIAAGFGVHWLASKLGVNRAIAKAHIPFIRI